MERRTDYFSMKEMVERIEQRLTFMDRDRAELRGELRLLELDMVSRERRLLLGLSSVIAIVTAISTAVAHFLGG
jgi:hypothetical protein